MKFRIPDNYEIKTQWKEGKWTFVIAKIELEVGFKRTMFVFEEKTSNLPIHVLDLPAI